MTNQTDICRAITAVVHREIPVARFMDVSVQSFAHDCLVLDSALAPNINVHGTAFAGSLYSLCALAGWSLSMLSLQVRDLTAEVVVATGEIKYRQPVQDERIIVRSSFVNDPEIAFKQHPKTGKSRVTILSEIGDSKKAAVTFLGDYVWLSK